MQGPSPIGPLRPGGGVAPAPTVGGVVEEVFVSGSADEGRESVGDEVLRRVNLVSKAQRGGFKVPEGVSDTERGVGAISGALLRFPCEHDFKAVGRTTGEEERRRFIELVVAAVSSRTGVPVPKDSVTVVDRVGGKFTSVLIRQTVADADQIRDVLDHLQEIPEVIMHW